MMDKDYDLLREKIVPANEECTVKSYQCTYYNSRLLGLEATGFLSVTNKRVIFQAAGASNAGPSVIQSEVPIEDVSGISSYKGTYFSLGHLLAAFVLSMIIASLLNMVLGTLSAILKDYDMILFWVVAIGAGLGSFSLPRKTLWRPVLASASAFTFSLIGGGSLLRNFSFITRSNSGETLITMLLSFVLGIYALACYLWYARRPTFSLAIHSKGGSSTPISISGASGLGILDVAAGRALNAEPAKDAEPLLKELGAVVLDIQKLGDFGIDKWQRTAFGIS